MRTLSTCLSLIALTLLAAAVEARAAQSGAVAVHAAAPKAAPKTAPKTAPLTPGQSRCTVLGPEGAACLAAGPYPGGFTMPAPEIAVPAQKPRQRRVGRVTIETIAGVTVIRGPGSRHLSP